MSDKTHLNQSEPNVVDALDKDSPAKRGQSTRQAKGASRFEKLRLRKPQAMESRATPSKRTRRLKKRSVPTWPIANRLVTRVRSHRIH